MQSSEQQRYLDDESGDDCGVLILDFLRNHSLECTPVIK